MEHNNSKKERSTGKGRGPHHRGSTTALLVLRNIRITIRNWTMARKKESVFRAAPHAVYPRLYADRAVFDHDYHLYHCGNSAGGLRHELPG